MSFPTTQILDNFNRGNSSTTLGSNWTVDANFNDPLGIISNTGYCPTHTNNALQYWNVNSFSGTIELFFTISTLPSGALYIGAFGDTSSRNGYYLGTGSGAQVLLKRMTNGAGTTIATYAQAMSNGDNLGFSITSAGVITSFYKSVSGTWTLLGSITDTNHTVAYIGILDGDSTGRFDNFGGGLSYVFMRKELTPNGTRIGSRQLQR